MFPIGGAPNPPSAKPVARFVDGEPGTDAAMTMHVMDTQQDAIAELRDGGFDHDAWIDVDGTVVVASFERSGAEHREAREHCPPDGLVIEETYRFEGASNPDDESMVLGVVTPDGHRAVLDVPYGADISGEQADAVRAMLISR